MPVRRSIVGIDSPDRLATSLRDAQYLADEGLSTAAYLSLALGKPLLLEGAPGVGKTEGAKALASILGRQLVRLQCYEGIDSAHALYEFIWDEYCAWYLELVKPVLWDEAASTERQRGTRRTLVRVLEAALRLAHPFMPYITEEIWQRVAPLAGKSGPTLMLQPWPDAAEERIDEQAEGDVDWLKALMLGVRQIRGEMNISMAKKIDLVLRNADASDQRRLAENEPMLKKLAKLESIRVLPAGQEPPLAATALVGEMEVLVPMAGLIDKDAELARLDKELARLDGEVKRVGGKLSNESFVAKAPAEVIDKERAKLAEAEQALAKLAEQRARIASL